MNINDIMNNLKQEHNHNSGWKHIGTVTIPPEEGYERSLTFQKGFEAHSLPCSYITELLNKFTAALYEKCNSEGLHLQTGRVPSRLGQGMYYVINGEWYSVMHYGNECKWCYLPYGENSY